jgi:hypothetical protein
MIASRPGLCKACECRRFKGENPANIIAPARPEWRPKPIQKSIAFVFVMR